MNKSSLFSTQRSTYSQILYCVLERWTRTLNQMWHGKKDWRGSKVHRIQSFGQNWWWANGIRVEHLPRTHHIAAQPQSPRVTVKIERNTREINLTDHLHVDVQRHLIGIKGQQERMRVKCSTRFSPCEEIRSRTMVIPWAWIREKVVFCQWRQSTRIMGQNCRADDVDIRRKRTPSLPSHESIVQRSA